MPTSQVTVTSLVTVTSCSPVLKADIKPSPWAPWVAKQSLPASGHGFALLFRLNGFPIINQAKMSWHLGARRGDSLVCPKSKLMIELKESNLEYPLSISKAQALEGEELHKSMNEMDSHPNDQNKQENKKALDVVLDAVYQMMKQDDDSQHHVREPTSTYRLGSSGIFSLAPGGFEAHEGDIILTSRDEEKEIHVLERHGTGVTATFLKSRLE
jgi:hypothetical protein